MADAIWPVGLPQAPLTKSYSQKDADRTVRSKMDVGPDKVRLRASAGVELCEIVLPPISGFQVAILKTFHRDTIAGGALAFSWKHHETGNPVDYRFTGPPEFQSLSPRQSGNGRWRCAFQLETLPGTEVIGPPPPPPPPPPPDPGEPLIYEPPPPAAASSFDDEVIVGYPEFGVVADPDPDLSGPVVVIEGSPGSAGGDAIYDSSGAAIDSGTTITGDSEPVGPSSADL